MLSGGGFLRDARVITRRAFFAVIGWLIFLVSAGIAAIASLFFLRPNALYEDPPQIKVGKPSDYAVGSTTVFTEKRVVLNRDPDGFYAIRLICTHLGCTPNYVNDVTKDLIDQGVVVRGEDGKPVREGVAGFKCPCHGSRFFRDSVNFFGPAPRPMDHLEIATAPDGLLMVDRSKIVDLKLKYRLA